MQRLDGKRYWQGILGLVGIALTFGGCGGATGDGTSKSGTPDGPDGALGTGGNTSGTGGGGPGGASSTGGASGCALGCGPMPLCPPGSRSFTPPGACCPTCGPDCSTVKCALPLCPPGSMPYTPSDQCCPACGPDCRLVDCAFPICPPGSKVVQSPGQCCGSCQPVAVEAGAPACNPGIDAFVKSRIAALGALSCATANDCEIVSLGGQCKLDCGTAVNVTSAGTLMKDVAAFSSANCAGCPQTNVACPPVYYTAECRNSQCTRSP